MNIEIYPLEKVVIDGSPVYLGMEQSAVENAIGKGQIVGKRYYYYNNEEKRSIIYAIKRYL